MTTALECPVQFTHGAISEIDRLMREDPKATGKWLRVGVKGGGCSGMTYVLNFDERTPADMQFDVDGISFIMDPSHEMYLYGMEIHFEGGLNSRGFTFTNPNASKTCGCGTSFSV
ncbi:MAG TPA: iron-sulfur cluster assembly accessory protein [Phnomibacter sp.]|nr:iron-sulfur cluster assembly accessory protein [Phnomibacter sp.]